MSSDRHGTALTMLKRDGAIFLSFLPRGRKLTIQPSSFDPNEETVFYYILGRWGRCSRLSLNTAWSVNTRGMLPRAYPSRERIANRTAVVLTCTASTGLCKVLDVGGRYPGLYTVVGSYNDRGDFYTDNLSHNIYFELESSSGSAASGGDDDGDNDRRRLLDGKYRGLQVACVWGGAGGVQRRFTSNRLR